MARYAFVTEMRVPAPIEDVHRTIVEPEQWLARWADVVRVTRTSDGDENGVGASFDASVRAPLGYRFSGTITVTEVATTEVATSDAPAADGEAADRTLHMSAEGDLEGSARWDLTAGDDGITDIRFDWEVRSRVAWLNALSPVLRPLLERSHHVVVRRAARAAADSLGVPLLSCRSHARR